jgi:hypothetical protein
VFSGLSLATLLTLFIIPCFYILLHEFPGGKKRAHKRRQVLLKQESLETASTGSPHDVAVLSLVKMGTTVEIATPPN